MNMRTARKMISKWRNLVETK